MTDGLVLRTEVKEERESLVTNRKSKTRKTEWIDL